MTTKAEITKIAREFEYGLLRAARYTVEKVLDVYKRKPRTGKELERLKMLESVVQTLGVLES